MPPSVNADDVIVIVMSAPPDERGERIKPARITPART
jgi:hypothetical protein